MKIAHVICGLRIGGAELMLADIMRAQAQLGHDVALIVINDWVDKEVVDGLPDSVVKVFVGRPQGSKNPWWILKYNLALRRMGADVIHFHDDMALAMTVGHAGKRYVYTIHAMNLNLRFIKKADAVFSISKAVQADVASRYGVESKVVYNGIQCDRILTTTHADKGYPFKIVQVSRLDHTKKGQDLLIEAVGDLVASGLDLNIDFIGEGQSIGFLKSVAQKNSISDRVNFLGAKSREYIYKHLCDYDIFVQPSREEGFGLTIAEAMAAGVPVLVSDISGPKEVVGDGEYGTLFKAESVDALADAIRQIYQNYAEYSAKAKKSVEYAKSAFDINSTALNYINAYID